jgi:DNA-binding MarR family transcriptional regulator
MRARRASPSANGGHPVTTTLPLLLRRGGDAEFRRFLYDFMTVADRMEALRDYFGRKAGITGPQYTLLMAVMQLDDGEGVPLRDVAAHLRVTRAFVTLESGRLIRAGILAKRANPHDGRSSLLSLSVKGRRLIDRLVPEVRSVNDLFFSRLDRTTYRQARSLLAELLEGSRLAMAHAGARHALHHDAWGGR